MHLTKAEAEVFELLRNNGHQSGRAIGEQLGVSSDTAGAILRKLAAKDAIRKIRNGVYELLIDSYETVEEVEVRLNNHHINLDTSRIPDDVKRYIINHAPYMRRSQLSRKLKIPKLLINQILDEAKQKHKAV